MSGGTLTTKKAFTLVACALLLGCAGLTPAGGAGTPTVPSGADSPVPPAGLTAATTSVDMEAFMDWRQAFRKKAIAAGISSKTFKLAFANVKPNLDILMRDQTQPEVGQAVWSYIENAASQKRIEAGRAKLAEQQATLAKIEQQYGVDRRYVVAIWGLESNYGTLVGKFNVFEGLATLAYEGRRREFAEGELIAALKIVERGDETADRMIGSWAGALGQTQFLPSAYLAYAVDQDGDGRRDLFDSTPDVLASIANFLAKSGWKSGMSWGEEVKLPAGFDYALADPTIRLPLARWRQIGITDVKGKLMAEEPTQAALFLPAGYRGPAFVTLDNFRVFLRYNNSTPYALGAGYLGDVLTGGSTISQAWPRDERPLTLTERKELQTLLNQLGYSVGTADGIVGAGTRAGLRNYQKKIDVPADGFATVSVLEQLRKDAGQATIIPSPAKELASTAPPPSASITQMQPIPNP